MEVDKAWLETMVQQRKSMWKGRTPSTQYLCIENFVLQHGQEFQWAPCPDEFRGGEMKECFKNAYQLFISHEKIRYVEGYARRIEVPLVTLHGWCIDENGKVLDPTWEGDWYFGVVFDLDYVSAVLLARNKYGVLDVPELRFPLITGRHRYLGDGKVEYDREELLKLC